jgi:hypothetical protein
MFVTTGLIGEAIRHKTTITSKQKKGAELLSLPLYVLF